jgi:hypothetical protein
VIKARESREAKEETSMQIGDRVEVIGDANKQLLGKTGTVTDIVVMDLSPLYPSGWRAATAEDFRQSKAPYHPHFTGSNVFPDELPTEIYFRVRFDVPSILPEFNGHRRELIKDDVFGAESLRSVAARLI